MFHVRQWCLLYLLTFNKLTNSQKQCPSRKANSFSTSHERSSILQDPKVHHLVHNSPPPEPVLSRINSVHAIHPILEYRFYYYLSPLRRGLPSGFLLLSFTTKTSHTPLLSPTLATCLAHLIPLYLITRIFKEYRWWRSSVCSFLQSPVPPRPTSSSSHYSQTPSAYYVPPTTWQTKSDTHIKQHAKLRGAFKL